MNRSLSAGLAMLVSAGLLATGCGRKPKFAVTGTPSPEATAASTPTPTPAPPEKKGWFESTPKTPAPPPLPSPPLPPEKIWEEFSGDRAFADVVAQVAIGPRPSGSEALEKTRKYIIDSLEKAGWEVERQTFTDSTPHGEMQFTNLIARFKAADPSAPAAEDTQRVIVASHYDTKYFGTIRFVGAHDGASSTGALLELARVLALDWDLAKQVELVFFDGEEALVQFTQTDGLYGSRHYAEELEKSGRAKQFEYGVLLDMIGDRDLTLTISPDSPKELARGIFAAAETLGLRNSLSYFNRDIGDDHVPLNKIGIPTIDLIDFDYLYWHTADDTLDKLSPKSVEKVGQITLFYINSRR